MAALLIAGLFACARAGAADGLVLSDPPGESRRDAGAGRAAAVPSSREAESPLIVGEDESLWQLFRKGGVVMPAILIASIVALAFAIERFVALRPSVQTPPRIAEELAARLSRGGMAPAVSLVRGREGVLPRMLESALGRIDEGRDAMEEAASAESQRGLYELRRNVRPIGIVARAAPLMGLLGTVLGMIKAFDRVSVGSLGRGEELARGIAEALLTTGAGLLVAIPALLVYHYLRGRSEDLVRRAEAETVRFIDRASSQLREGPGAAGRAAGRPAGREGGGQPGVDRAGTSGSAGSPTEGRAGEGRE